MRISRKILLTQNGGFVHKYWQAHDRQFLLLDPAVKNLYLKSTAFALKHKSVQEEVKLHAFCVMSNHAHQLLSYKSTSHFLSNYMRLAHSRFGQIFNKWHNRAGAVVCGRPKTPLVQPNQWHLMRVHFYIESNPLRAKMVRNLKLYKASSFRFYAWGITDDLSRNLDTPEWYLKLGNTARDRQSKYRKLFDRYLRETKGAAPQASLTHELFLGDLFWVLECRNSLKTALSKSHDPPSCVN